MRAALLIVPLLLTACATPREACIADVSRQVSILNNLIVQTEGNLERGYALEQRQRIRTRRSFCRGSNSNRSRSRSRCDRIDTITQNVPVAIDLEAERAKLASLQLRQSQNVANAQAGLAQCAASFPE